MFPARFNYYQSYYVHLEALSTHIKAAHLLELSPPGPINWNAATADGGYDHGGHSSRVSGVSIWSSGPFVLAGDRPLRPRRKCEKF